MVGSNLIQRVKLWVLGRNGSFVAQRYDGSLNWLPFILQDQEEHPSHFSIYNLNSGWDPGNITCPLILWKRAKSAFGFTPTVPTHIRIDATDEHLNRSSISARNNRSEQWTCHYSSEGINSWKFPLRLRSYQGNLSRGPGINDDEITW